MLLSQIENNAFASSENPELGETLHIFHTFQNVLKLYIWSALLGLTASTTATNPQFCYDFFSSEMPATGLMCFYMQKVRSDGTLEEHHPLDLLFPSIYFYDVILLRAFLQQQTDEWTAATAREKKKLESDRHSHWVCIRNGKPFSKCWIIILFYFMRCIGESIIIFTFTFRAGEGRDISQRKSVEEREREYIVVCFKWYPLFRAVYGLAGSQRKYARLADMP